MKDIVDGPVNDRKIYYYWEPVGNRGKTTLIKHLCIQYNKYIVVDGKASDMKYACSQIPRGPAIVLVDIPRSSAKYVSWAGIEKVKDGIFFSRKYESAMTIYDCPHVIVFANQLPEMEALSYDRWSITMIQ